MPAPRILILRAPGTNCDQETAYAFELAGGRPEHVHINRLLEQPRLIADFQILCLQGGFSYGDDVASGRILANQLRHHLHAAIGEFKAAGKLVMGICNGFQVLIKSGILLSDDALGAPATLTLNESGKYEDRWVRLAVPSTQCVFLRGIDTMYLPVAHAEGRFVPRDAQTLQQLSNHGQLVLRYTTTASTATEGTVPFPDNPNGSIANVAGVCDETGRVFGLMPHPERHIDRTHHPRWTRGEGSDPGDGLRVFQNAVQYFGT
jgi:phosphoribosylformylglycinamidine synthase